MTCQAGCQLIKRFYWLEWSKSLLRLLCQAQPRRGGRAAAFALRCEWRMPSLPTDLSTAPPMPHAPAGPAPGGYDHNVVLFSLGPHAKDKVHGGMASET